MATLDNAAVVRQVYECFNNKDLDRLESLHTPDAQITVIPFGTKMKAREYAQMWLNAFSDGQIEAKSFVVQGDIVVCELTGRGTHTGTFRSPAGELPATNRSVQASFIEVLRVRNGKIAESRVYFDVLSIMAQLGVGAPSPGARATTPDVQPRH